MTMKFHEFVTSRRIRFNLDRQELAKQAHISDVRLRHIEDGGQIPDDMTILSNLADALQVDREWFRDFAYMKSELFTDVSRQEE
jgi:transcriptional regulator with XRE-family HTH domain